MTETGSARQSELTIDGGVRRLVVAAGLGLLFAVVLTGLVFWLLGLTQTDDWNPWDETKKPEIYDMARATAAITAVLGAAVGLAIALLKQRSTEQTTRLTHETTRLAVQTTALAVERHELDAVAALRGRYTTAAEQLGDDSPVVRLAGVYAMAALADEWADEGRPTEVQTCVDVLCAYLRTPRAYEADDEVSRTADREVRQTIVRVISSHLRPSTERTWGACDFDFSNAVFDFDTSFDLATFSGEIISFDGASFSGENTEFTETVFSGRKISFMRTSFSGENTSFEEATFSSEITTFDLATFSGEKTSFDHATFTSEITSFDAATFSAKFTSFNRATFSGATSMTEAVFSSVKTSFAQTKFPAYYMAFVEATFSGANTFFAEAVFSGSNTLFHGATFSGTNTWFDGARFSGTNTEFTEAAFSGENISFMRVTFSGENTSFEGATFSSGYTSFDLATLSGENTSFDGTAFIGAVLSFEHAQFSCQSSFSRTKFSGRHASFRAIVVGDLAVPTTVLRFAASVGPATVVSFHQCAIGEGGYILFDELTIDGDRPAVIGPWHSRRPPGQWPT